ncbi:PH domain-containing protein [Staphylococcus canis]|uniref:PH domain-containing protein n=1 Tax=Staphylococcus canis TaxID=2724942 RepID=A0ABS0T9Z1_9STAP|nr:PH domain-containing protein [Staphylococcus canis]MBI5975492.1 PH domain-containing protein [Staphylococcus canis]
MYKPQKLHPISYIMGIVDVIKRNFFIIVVFLFFQLKSFDFTNLKQLIVPGIIGVFLLFGFIMNSIKVYRTRFWIEGEHFIVTSGLLNHERRELNIRRIQSIDTTENIVQQLMKGVKLIVKTPSDGIELETITRTQSEAIRRELEYVKHQILEETREESIDDGVSETDQPLVRQQSSANDIHLFHLSKRYLLFMAMTSNALLVALAAIGPIIGAIDDLIPWGSLTRHIDSVFHMMIDTTIILIIIGLILSYGLGVVINFIRYFGFSLTRNGDLLHVRYGLFNVKQMTVPLSRIQAVFEKQSVIQRLFGFTSFHLMITSDMQVKLDDETIEGNVMILPFIKRKEALSILKTLVPSTSFDTVNEGLPWRGFHRRFWVHSLVLLGVGAIFHYYSLKWFWIPIGILIVLLILRSLLSVLKDGIKLKSDEIIVRQLKMMTFETTYVHRNKILGFEKINHPLMKRAHLSHFNYIIASGASEHRFGLKFVESSEVQQCFDWYIGGEDHV